MKYKSSFLNEAAIRGFFYQSTNLEAMDEYLCEKGRLAYTGFDITAKSLHVGHLIPIFLLRLFQKHGHKPVILVGGGTTKIGDPSFRNTTRPMLSDEQIADNLVGIKKCLMPFFKFGDGASDAIIVNNADWLNNLNYIPFLRDIGTCFSINRMVGFESVKAKLSENNTLSFLEFNYMILQAYDFYKLFTEKGCSIQFGGQDQWGNIVCGVELIRKKTGKEVFGFTNPLLTTSDGKKMGKTANGAVWLSKDLLSAYDFWQYWRNVDDADVIKCMYLFTDIDVNEIKKMESVRGQELNELKKILADEVTTIIHGKDSLDGIHQTVSNAFSKGTDLNAMTSLPRYKIDRKDLETTSAIDVIVAAGLCASRGDAKRLIRGGGVYVDDEPITEEYRFNADKKLVKLSCGKKKHLIVEI
ncbi:MAG: tyrosine--tRNA ligase [Alphaproteobacteria bacterium]|nr:tyrosine--tRNA ligase [Alphaproteobacteria bacterium]